VIEQAATGPGIPASLAFRRCPGCAKLHYEAEDGCTQCRHRYTQRPTCDITYCVDCGWTVPWPKVGGNRVSPGRSRCRKCADLYRFNVFTIPDIIRTIAQKEARAALRQKDDQYMLRRIEMGMYVAAPSESKVPCAVPTCGKGRIYVSRFCQGHDEDLNGPLHLLVLHAATTGYVARCFNCRVYVHGGDVTLHGAWAIAACPFHQPTQPDWLARHLRWNESIEAWTMSCPVCWKRFTSNERSRWGAWAIYAEHHLVRHKEVAYTLG
jgi:hypothetical protein